MSYFNFLPSTYYRVDKKNSIVVKNILVRAKIHEFFRSSTSSALEYTIKDEEKPETLSARVYGRPDYHWIILLYNEIHDPYFKWPMSVNELEKHLQATYTGQSIYVNPLSIQDINSGKLFDKKYQHFNVGDVVVRKNRDGKVVASGSVVSWDPSFYKLVVDDVSGSFVGDSSGTSILYSTTKDKKDISVPIKRVTTENIYALHHFEKENGEIISPLYRPRQSSGESIVETPDRIIDRFVNGVELIDIGVDPSGQQMGYVNSITNIQYEEKNNDSKRKIRVMRPEFIDSLLRDFRELFLFNRS